MIYHTKATTKKDAKLFYKAVKISGKRKLFIKVHVDRGAFYNNRSNICLCIMCVMQVCATSNVLVYVCL